MQLHSTTMHVFTHALELVDAVNLPAGREELYQSLSCIPTWYTELFYTNAHARVYEDRQFTESQEYYYYLPA